MIGNDIIWGASPGSPNLHFLGVGGPKQSGESGVPKMDGQSGNVVGSFMPSSGAGNSVSTYQPTTVSAPTFQMPDIGSKLGEAPTYTPPEAYTAPSYSIGAYTAPQYDEGKVNALTQQQSAAGIRGLRSAIQRAMVNGSDNPNVKKMTLREALAGYGQGLQSVMTGAAKSAREMYNTQYGYEADAAKTSYSTMADAAKTNFQASADASKMNYQANVDAAQRNFEAQFEKYKMKWSDLSDAAKMEYTARYQTAIANAQSKNAASQFGASSQNQWNLTQYQGNLQKQLAEYDAAVKDYLKNGEK